MLGQGCSEKVYLSSDSAGQMFAVKLYLYDSMIMQSFAMTTKRAEEVATEIRDIEANEWRAHYPTYKEAIYECELFEVPRLAMPFVSSIPIERRKILLPKFRQEMRALHIQIPISPGVTLDCEMIVTEWSRSSRSIGINDKGIR